MNINQLYTLGYTCLQQKNYPDAMSYFHEAAQGGHWLAQLWLENMDSYVHMKNFRNR
ncbi:MAG TPA: hypothetical protein VHE99_00345 [Gammaproteobacteria bacterium]|nr:hypothetical protein [Gammaproteobacteria bacterium]